jgi:uncharacterized RDD family membrane protein YckC
LNDDPPNPAGQNEPSRPAPFGRFFSARPEGSWYPKAEPLPRLLARLTDFILAALLVLAAGRAGPMAAALYLLFADGLFRGQSAGKRLLGIKVVALQERREAGYRESALRNFPFALVPLAHYLPGFGDLLLVGGGLGLVTFEGLRAFTDGLGLRLGDLVAGTQVVDTKVVVGMAVQPLLKRVPAGGSHAAGAARALEPCHDLDPS